MIAKKEEEREVNYNYVRLNFTTLYILLYELYLSNFSLSLFKKKIINL